MKPPVLTAAESGLKAIVLEKMDIIGGSGPFPEGSLGIGSRIAVRSITRR